MDSVDFFLQSCNEWNVLGNEEWRPQGAVSPSKFDHLKTT